MVMQSEHWFGETTCYLTDITSTIRLQLEKNKCLQLDQGGPYNELEPKEISFLDRGPLECGGRGREIIARMDTKVVNAP